MIGLEPSDQVLVKGYLRVLLRVDFDIEWVQPKHPQANLFLVNHSFANAEAVRHIVNEQKLPALYVTKTADKKNVIENNVLYLSLKHLDVLKAWLHEHVPLIRGEIATDDLPNDDNDITVEFVNQHTQASLVEPSSAAPASTKQVPSFSEPDTDLADLYNQLHKLSSDNFYTITQDGKPVAIFQPSTRRAWARGDAFYPAFSCKWQLSSSSNDTPSDKYALNLNQWLWRCCMQDGSEVSELLPQDVHISLATWPKPNSNKQKSATLKILALAELRSVNTLETSSLLNVDKNLAHNVLAALYFSGLADTSGLVSPDAPITNMLGERKQLIDTIEMEAIEAERSAGVPVLSAPEKEDDTAETYNSGLSGILLRIRESLGLN